MKKYSNEDIKKGIPYALVGGVAGGIGAYRIVRKLTKALGLDNSLVGKTLDIFIAILVAAKGVDKGADAGAKVYEIAWEIANDRKERHAEETKAENRTDDGIHFDDASDVMKRGPRFIK